MIEVTITVKRGDEAQGKSYLMKELGASRKGTYLTFTATSETPDLPAFGKVYIKTERDKAKAEKAAKVIKTP